MKNIFFNGNLSLRNSWGTLIKTEELIADFERKLLIGPKSVLAKTEFGSLASGKMEYHYNSDVGEEMFFSDGVKIEIFFD